MQRTFVSLLYLTALQLANVRVYLPDLFHGDAIDMQALSNPELRAKFDFKVWQVSCAYYWCCRSC